MVMLPSMQVMSKGMNDDDSVTSKMKSHDELEVSINDDEHYNGNDDDEP